METQSNDQVSKRKNRIKRKSYYDKIYEEKSRFIKYMIVFDVFFTVWVIGGLIWLGILGQSDTATNQSKNDVLVPYFVVVGILITPYLIMLMRYDYTPLIVLGFQLLLVGIITLIVPDVDNKK